MPGLPAIKRRSPLLPLLIFHHSDLLVEVFGCWDVDNLHFELFVVVGVLVFILFALMSWAPLEWPFLHVFFTVVLFPTERFLTIIIFIGHYVSGVQSISINSLVFKLPRGVRGQALFRTLLFT